ncbi:hypothetical protein TNCV_1391301 [Trichonephila clavipes]|nr:hypothetical protein TNCV_1391301 [Trichonephila clavipes]
MAFLLRERKDVLLEVAKELRVEIDITLPKIEFKKRICQSKYYVEESVKCLLEGILAEKRETRESERQTREYEERKLIREFELQRLRAQLSNKLNENKLKAGNRINDLANVCILSGKRTAEVSEPVNKCRPLINRVVNKSVENATSCDFEKENCDPPVRWTNVSPLSEVSGRRTEKNNLFKIVEGKEFNAYRNSDCEVKMKAGLCEGRVKLWRRVQSGSNIGSEFNFEIDLPGKRDRSTIYRLNLIKMYRRKPELANLVMEKSSEGLNSEILHSVKLFMDFGFQDPGTIVLRQKDINLVTGKPFRIKTCSSQMLINSLREDTEYLLDLGVNGMGQSNRTQRVVWLGRVNRYPYPRIKCIKYRNLNQGEGVVTSSMVVNPHLSIHDKCYGFTSCSGTSTTSSIVPEFLRFTSCKMTSARGHGAIVYCLNSGSEDRQTGRHNGKKEENEKRREREEREKTGENKTRREKRGRRRERMKKDERERRGRRRERMKKDERERRGRRRKKEREKRREGNEKRRERGEGEDGRRRKKRRERRGEGGDEKGEREGRRRKKESGRERSPPCMEKRAESGDWSEKDDERWWR